MSTILKVSGMHCDACKALITMELEDAQLDKYVDSVELKDDNQGEVILNTDDSEVVSKAASIINKMDNYEIK